MTPRGNATSAWPPHRVAPNRSQLSVADAQRRARLDKIAEARCQLDEELALLHQELGMDAEHRNTWHTSLL
jgi:hypothetical protein